MSVRYNKPYEQHALSPDGCKETDYLVECVEHKKRVILQAWRCACFAIENSAKIRLYSRAQGTKTPLQSHWVFHRSTLSYIMVQRKPP